MLAAPLLSFALLGGLQANADVAAGERAALAACIPAQAARFERIESRVMDAANLVVTIGCKAEVGRYFEVLGLPFGMQAMLGADASGDPVAFHNSTQRAMVISQELLEQAAIAVIEHRERRLGASNN